MRSVDDEVRKAVSEQVVQSSETIENLRIEVVDLKARACELERVIRNYHVPKAQYSEKVLEVKRLKAENMKLKQAWDALPRSEAVDQLIASRDEVERLKAERDRHAFNCEQLRSSPLFQSGMEAAAKDVHGCPWIQGPAIAEWLRDKIKAAKEQADGTR